MSSEISSVSNFSILKKSGIESGDSIISINGNVIDDFLDYAFYSASNEKFLFLEFKKKNSNKIKKLKFKNDFSGNLGIELSDFKVMRCGNKCVFCFCDQHPETSRSSLFFKDEDYRLSFLYGNYLTLSNLSEKHYNKIFSLRLSPLYISVHSTNDNIRRKILGVNYKFKILDKLKDFAANKIEMNFQIVLIPEYNDNDINRSLSDLEKLYPYVKSIAIVPVGLTKFRNGLTRLKPVDKRAALKIVDTVERFQKKCLKWHETRLAFLSDEFYILAQKKLPDYECYEDFSQLENGVGLSSKFECELKSGLKKYKNKIIENAGKNFFAITGKISAAFMQKISDYIFSQTGVLLNVISVENKYFGKNITVTGLLSGTDIAGSLIKLKSKNKLDKNSPVLIPDIALRYGKDIFIDDMRINRLKSEFNIRVVGSSAAGLLKALSKK
ncbi:MAG TPA: DUF512 domain-containing protein [bacterium]|nr:DUF512 domain-containing protein [bacterium]HPN29967.1 DUF512 domain-containing protein [bacterium]